MTSQLRYSSQHTDSFKGKQNIVYNETGYVSVAEFPGRKARYYIVT